MKNKRVRIVNEISVAGIAPVINSNSPGPMLKPAFPNQKKKRRVDIVVNEQDDAMKMKQRLEKIQKDKDKKAKDLQDLINRKKESKSEIQKYYPHLMSDKKKQQMLQQYQDNAKDFARTEPREKKDNIVVKEADDPAKQRMENIQKSRDIKAEARQEMTNNKRELDAEKQQVAIELNQKKQQMDAEYRDKMEKANDVAYGINEALVLPKKGEDKDDFISRFMSDKQSKIDFPEHKQRVAVAFSQWDRKHNIKEGVEVMDIKNTEVEMLEEENFDIFINEGIAEGIKRNISSMLIRFIPEKKLDEMLNRFNSAAQSRLSSPEEKQASNKYFDTKGKTKDQKIALVRSLLSKAPDQEISKLNDKTLEKIQKLKNNQGMVKESNIELLEYTSDVEKQEAIENIQKTAGTLQTAVGVSPIFLMGSLGPIAWLIPAVMGIIMSYALPAIIKKIRAKPLAPVMEEVEHELSNEDTNIKLISMLKVVYGNLHVIHRNLKGEDWFPVHELFGEYYEKIEDFKDDTIEIFISMGVKEPSEAEAIQHYESISGGEGFSPDQAFALAKKYFNDLHAQFELINPSMPNDVKAKFEEYQYWLRKEANYKIAQRLSTDLEAVSEDVDQETADKDYKEAEEESMGTDLVNEAKSGLYDNIHKKRMRIKMGSGEKMRKPNSKGAPTDKSFKAAAKTIKENSNEYEHESGEYDQEGSMAKSQLKNIINHTQELHDSLEDQDNLPEWVQSKLAVADDHLTTISDYMKTEVQRKEEENVSVNEGLLFSLDLLSYITEDFSNTEKDFLLNLNESKNLNEGKMLDSIRWKLAKFSLRFLSDKSLNEFLEAYYSDKEGKSTEKSKAVSRMSRKEKINKLRDLSNSMSEEQKKKIYNSPEAKKLEKQALTSIAVAGALGVTAALAPFAQNSIGSTSADLKKLKDSQGLIAGEKSGEYFGNTLDKESKTWVNKSYDTYLDNNNIPNSEIKDNVPFGSAETFTNVTNDSNYDYFKDLSPKVDELGNTGQSFAAKTLLSRASLMLSVLASTMFGVMWGSLIAAGVSGVQGLRKLSKATTLRRDEILDEIKKGKKNIKEDVWKGSGVPRKTGNELDYNQSVKNVNDALTMKKEPSLDKEKAIEAYKKQFTIKKSTNESLTEQQAFLSYLRILREAKDVPSNPEYGVPKLNKFPLYDEVRVKSAIRFFNYVEPVYEEKLAAEIIKRMKKYGLNKRHVGNNNRLKKYVDQSRLPEGTIEKPTIGSKKN
jgi:DNA-binding ferritin-like protein